uniref:Calponin-homology (CH) domain-containing protein n=1 Tax=Strix occidentalis caurina TaxID=311401 RepID=A0A8D0FDB0_STROC
MGGTGGGSGTLCNGGPLGADCGRWGVTGRVGPRGSHVWGRCRGVVGSPTAPGVPPRAATGPAPHLKRSGGTAAVKAMLLEWCRSRTRGYQVSTAGGHTFFPDAFDYGSLEPGARRHNFALAFATAEEQAGCAPLLEVEDMVRLPVPDAKCVYTYLQELYRCLVAKGLVKTKKR